MVTSGFLIFMTNDYYSEEIRKIKELIEKKDYVSANIFLQEELRMPYIPAGTEQELRKIEKDLKYLLADSREPKHKDALELLKGNAVEQMQAVQLLNDQNLRNFLPEIQAYLSGKPNPEAAALLMNSIAEQEIDEEFTFHKNGLEYAFFGDELVPVEKSPGLRKALVILEDKLGKDHPDLYRMARQIVVYDAFMELPLTMDDMEAETEAEKAVQSVKEMMGISKKN